MTTYPGIEELKAQAKRLRQAMNDRGTALTHSAALEMIARQHGVRDWNTLAALAAKPNAAAKTPLFVGAHIRGRYLNQPFTGEIISLSALPGGLHRITIHFDEALDVVTFESFSAFRRRVTAQIDGDGVSPRKTSNGVPHLVLDL
ncbi:glyoxalase superfamily protein [Rhizobium sp. CBN3]|uniref:glyoxalase superfamily protein n=1 Tax=Rhizobium sp. CBN3 TaxID=3058045 RepID=UPI0026711B0F|nr:glyoxalase superfamily protein [Rhizobium sp. CBN3]MDO3432419.1 glyoxalase superfamily protein [Rhizobium sp. CBN3]